MRFRFLISLGQLCFAVFMLSCSTDDRVMEQIYDAELIAQQDPQHALELISSVDRKLVNGKRDKARYALVMCEVMYHNYLDSDCDTLSGPMVDYYLASDNHHERARALYQHSLIVKRKGDDYLAHAMLALLEAEKSLDIVDDVKLRGLVYRTEADIYGKGCLFANALESYKKAKECFDRLDEEYYSASILYDMGATYIQLREHNEAYKALSEALAYGREAQNKRFTAAVLHELLDLSIYMDNYELCRTYIDMFRSEDCLLFGQAHLSSMQAMLLSHDGNKQQALDLLQRAADEEGAEWADLEYAYYIVYRNSGDMREALRWEERSKNAQDERMLEVLKQPVLNIQIEMLQKDVEARRVERELVRQRNTIIYIAIALIVVIVTYVVWRRIRLKNEDIARYVETIRDLNATLKSVPEEMTASISALYRDRFSELNELCDIYYDHSGSSRHKNMVFNKLSETIDAIKNDKRRMHELERAVDEYRNGLMMRLHRVLPKLSERDSRVALYSFAGFSNRAIAIFIDSDPVAVSKIKYNIKYKLKSVEGDDAEIIVAALSEK